MLNMYYLGIPILNKLKITDNWKRNENKEV